MILTTTTPRNTKSSSARCRALAALALACMSPACSGSELDERDLGNTSPLLTSSESPAHNERLPVVGPDGVDPFVVGRWVGAAENLFAPSEPDGSRPAYAFPSGSTDFTLDISLSEFKIPGGQIAFGSALLPVPAPEPGVVYPPGFDVQGASSGISLELELPPLEGLVYPLHGLFLGNSADGGGSAGALALSYASNQAYVDWCSLQSPNPRGDGRFDCLTLSDPDDPTATCFTVDDNGTEVRRYDCDLYLLCGANNVCSCNETECRSANGALGHIWFIRDGDDLLGTFVDAVFDHGGSRSLPVGTVRFQRVSP